MITLKNVNKYFFRHKRNEIHVINDTSLELGDTGLVALLGPSGCGKTTLLNAIGGLDKINSGKIYINGKKMPKTGSSKKDKIRVLNIGYIFQNYNLLDNMTVFDNVAISLRMIGVKNKQEIKRRVEYILECVGMYRYRNKLAGLLSGGQRQRVGIARALVKNPDVIIADEPTGNLDSKNTLEIMNIIKSISVKKLVILVTHEKNLAEFYASRIISLEDGKVIKDIENIHENELDYRIDNNVYLKDFTYAVGTNDEDRKVRFYFDEGAQTDLDIVIKNGSIYIRSNDGKKIEVVDEDSGIEFVNDHYRKIAKDDYINSTFDLSQLDNSKNRLRYSSIYNVFSMLKAGARKVSTYTIMKKVLLIGFFVAAMFIVYALSSVFGSLRVDETKFVTEHRDYIRILNKQNNVDEYYKIEALEGVDYVLPGSSSISMEIKNESLFQLRNLTVEIYASIVDIEKMDKDSIVYGKYPSSDGEIVVDKNIIKRAKKDEMFTALNFHNDDDLIGETVRIGGGEFVISGICETDEIAVYMNKNKFIGVLGEKNDTGEYYDVDFESSSDNSAFINVKNYEEYKNDIELKEGRAPEADYEVVVNIDYKSNMPLGKEVDAKINNKKLKVVGYYYSNRNVIGYFVNNNTYKINTILKYNNLTIMPKDKEKTIADLKEMGYNAKDIYSDAREDYLEDIHDEVVGSLIVSGILLLISFVEIFLMIRASFLSRIKEIGIYRAIGVKKMDIYKMFMGEILIITTLTAVPSIIFMSSLLNEITKVSYFNGLFVMNKYVVICSFILIYAFNLIVGLLPINRTISKTPAEILSRNDVD